MEIVKEKPSLQNVKEADKKKSSSELVKREKVKDSPFEIISVDGYHFGSMGNYRITEKEKSIKKLRDDLKNITWNRIIQIVMILDDIREKQTEVKQKINKK